MLRAASADMSKPEVSRFLWQWYFMSHSSRQIILLILQWTDWAQVTILLSRLLFNSHTWLCALSLNSIVCSHSPTHLRLSFSFLINSLFVSTIIFYCATWSINNFYYLTCIIFHICNSQPFVIFYLCHKRKVCLTHCHQNWLHPRHQLHLSV